MLFSIVIELLQLLHVDYSNSDDESNKRLCTIFVSINRIVHLHHKRCLLGNVQVFVTKVKLYRKTALQ